MSRKKKLIDRLLSLPRDFTFAELVTLLELCGFKKAISGKTSGSRVCFKNKSGDAGFKLHKPHPQNELKLYQLKEVIQILTEEGEL